MSSGVAVLRLRRLRLPLVVAAKLHLRGRVEVVQVVAVLLLQLGKTENLEEVGPLVMEGKIAIVPVAT